MDTSGLSGVADARDIKMSEKDFHDHVAQPGPPGAVMESRLLSLNTSTGPLFVASVVHSKGFGLLFAKFGKEKEHGADVEVHEANESASDDLRGMSAHDVELLNARRALRQAGWATVFYLVTCDILGPFNAPFAIASIGLTPGVLLYILFGAFAFLSGVMLCKIFCRLDSVRFPIQTYGDLGYVIFGPVMRHFASLLQTVQLIINVGIICLSNGQSLSQLVVGGGHTICFTVCILIWAILAWFLVKSVPSKTWFSIVANASVWLNLLIIFTSMGFIANSPPNFAAAQSAASYGTAVSYTGPIQVLSINPIPVFAQVNGVFNMEWPLPQLLIFCCYLMYGIFVYCFQGQYTLALAYQGVSKYSWQSLGNALAMITGAIAAGLYGNIGFKIFYINIIEGLLGGPAFMTIKGPHHLAVLIPTGLLRFDWNRGPRYRCPFGTHCRRLYFQFTYTFPPLLMLGLDMQLDAMTEDEAFTTPGVTPKRIDTWRDLSRWKRGFFFWGPQAGRVQGSQLLFFLVGVATAGLGMWATGTDLKEVIAAGAASSFGCAAPV
ncbi:hypothetical protein B0H13DRAFT_2574471 [Mycena leptocephala]|nr:hypothetical protein B0H13DRAFT_2574471 [Mycena leptocephala]